MDPTKNMCVACAYSTAIPKVPIGIHADVACAAVSERTAVAVVNACLSMGIGRVLLNMCGKHRGLALEPVGKAGE